MEMGCVYCTALVECLHTIQASVNVAYCQGFRQHLTIIIKDYLLAYTVCGMQYLTLKNK